MKTAAIIAALLVVGGLAFSLDARKIGEFQMASYPMGVAGYCIGYPAAMAADANGNLYIADAQNHRVSVIRSDGAMQTFTPGFDVSTCFLGFDSNRLIAFGQQPLRNLQVFDVATRKVVFDIRSIWEDRALKRMVDSVGFSPTMVAGDLLFSESAEQGVYTSLQFFAGTTRPPIFRDVEETKRFIQSSDGRSRKLSLDKGGTLIYGAQPLTKQSERIFAYWNASRRIKLTDNPLTDYSLTQPPLFDRLGNFYSYEGLNELCIRNGKGDAVGLYELPSSQFRLIRLLTVDSNGTIYFMTTGNSYEFVLYKVPRKW